MSLTALSYLGLRCRDLADWAGYGTALAGLQCVDRTARTLTFRMDDRRQRLMVEADGGAGIRIFGWEVADKAALDAMAGRLEAKGVAVAAGSAALAAERHVEALILLDDPLGNRIEICCGPETAAEPFVPGRAISGFRTGALGLGHVVLNVAAIEPVAAFYRDILGLRVSDYYSRPYPAMFFHVNPRHHSFALVQTGTNAVHHLMLEHFSLDDVGQGYDLAGLDEGRVAVTLGRHCGDYMTSFYTRTPSDFMIEHGWGGRLIDPATWQPAERTEGPSLWGHERSWLPPEQRARALEMRLANAAKGLRRPVQVLDGNYNRMPGACPWWDGLKGGQD